jgi:hypothetical protein
MMLNENGRARSHDKHDKLVLVKPRCIEIMCGNKGMYALIF